MKTGRYLGTIVCQVDVASGASRCAPPAAGKPGGVSPYTMTDAKFVVRTGTGSYTHADSTYRLPVRILNVNQDYLGSPDGVQVTGIKLFLANPPYGSGNRAPGDTTPPGMNVTAPWTTGGQNVWARNHDGELNLTGPSQPYWNYAEMVALGTYSQWKELQFTLAPSVTGFTVAFGLFTAVPGEPTIPATPPDGFLISDDSVTSLYAPARRSRPARPVSPPAWPRARR